MRRTIAELQARLDEAEELVRAIRTGEVDALVVSGPQGDQVYTLKGADHPYRVMVETMSEGALILAADGRIVYSNQSFAAMLDTSLEQVIGLEVDHFILTEDLPRYRALIQEGETGTSKGEIRITSRDGRAVPVHLSISPFGSEEPGGTCVVAIDLTEQKRHQELINAEALERTRRGEAEAARQRIRSILESITDSFFSVDRFWRISDVNERAAAFWGRTRDELLGRDFWDISPEGTVPELDQHYRAAMAERVALHFDAPSAAAPGKWFERHIYPTDEGLTVYFRDITDRKRNEEHTAYQARLLANIHDAVLATDAQLRLTSWNSAAEDIYGWTASEVIGRRVDDVIRSELTDPQRSEELRTLAETGHLTSEVAQRTRDGRRIWVQGCTTALQDDTGRIIGYVAVNRDITKRMQAEEDLRRSEAHLIEAQRVGHVGSWEWNVATGECRWSLEHFRLFGVDPASFRPTKDNTQPLIHPDDFTRVENTLQEAVRSNTGFEVDYRIVRPDRSIRHHRGLGRPLVSETGDPQFIGVVIDLTDLKEAEQALRVSEERNRRYFDLGLIGMAIMSPSKGCVEVNAELCRILGYEREELLRMTWAEVTHPDDLAADVASFNRVLAGEIDAYSMDKRWIRKDGRVIDSIMSANCVRRADGSVEYFVGLVQDITARKQTDEALREANERVVMILDSITDRFLAVSKDWRFTYLNKHAAAHMRALGKDPEALIGSVVWDEFPDAPNEHTQRRVMSERVATTDELYYPLLGEWLENHFYPTRDGGMVTVQRDISEQRRAEEQLRRSEALLAEGQQLSRTGSWVFTPSTGEVYWSLEHYRLWGVDPATWALTPKAGRGLMHPEDRDEANQAFDIAVRERARFEREFRIIRPDGTLRHMFSVGRPVFNESGECVEYVGTVMDITDRKAEGAARDELRRRLVEAQEEERRRIALDMHDQFGQQLSAITLALSALKRESGRRTGLNKHLASLEALARQLDHDLELIVSRLRPPALDDLGLLAALTHYVKHWSEHFGIRAELHASGAELGCLNNEIDVALYRIAQEALNNIAKHARARNVAIIVDGHSDRASLIVEDDGVGFEVEGSIHPYQGFGIIGMRERATLLGGTLDVESKRARGTTVVARIPLPPTPNVKAK